MSAPNPGRSHCAARPADAASHEADPVSTQDTTSGTAATGRAVRRRGNVVVGDTGPFLCAGGVRREHGMNVLFQRYNTGGRSIQMPQEVADELANQAKGSDKRAKAAQRITGRSSFVRVVRRDWADDDWNRVESVLVGFEQTRAQDRGRTAKTANHDGDIAGILLALESDALFLTNDVPALRAAKQLGLRAATFAAVLAAEVRDNRLAPEDAVTALEELQQWTFTGLSAPSVNAITTQPKVDGI